MGTILATDLKAWVAATSDPARQQDLSALFLSFKRDTVWPEADLIVVCAFAALGWLMTAFIFSFGFAAEIGQTLAALG
jgi:hypothetical protein